MAFEGKAPHAAFRLGFASAAGPGRLQLDIRSELGPDSDPRVARQLLATAAQTGPVRMEINGVVRASDSTLLQPRLAEQAARGVPNLSVRFTNMPVAPGSAMLLLLFDPPAELDLTEVCATMPLPAAVPSPEPLRLVADILRRPHLHRRRDRLHFRYHRRRRRPPRLAHGRHAVSRQLS